MTPLRRRSLLVAVGLGTVALAALGLWRAGFGGVDRHEDGAGPLVSNTGGPAESNFGMASAAAGKMLSAGILLCITGADAARIIDVRPTGTRGAEADWQYLGALARTMDPGRGDSPIYASFGFPPEERPATFSDARNALVQTPCSEDPGAPRVEVLMGFSSSPGSAGGGWTGEEIEYRAGLGTHVLVLHNTFVLCGPALADLSVCSGGS